MANPEDAAGIVATVTLELEPDRVPAAVFRNTVLAFVKSLDELTDRVCGNAKAIGWEISVSRGSLRIDAEPGEASDPGAVRRIRDLADNEPAVLRRHFASVADKGAKDVHLWIGRDRQPVARLGSDEPDGPRPFNEYGTVEGELEMMSVRGGPHFTIYEPIWDSGVRCTVPDELLDAMPDMWRKRVAAHGLIHYDAEGHPVSIKADEVAPFPHDETPIGAFRGILRADS